MATLTPIMPDLKQAHLPPSSNTPSRPDAVLIASAAVHHLRGDLARALECLATTDSALETSDVLRARGYIQLELADYTAAEHSYGQAAQQDTACVESWFQWGFCLHKLGNFAEALNKFEQAASIGTDWIEVPLAASICHLALKDYPKAIEKTRECLSVDSEYLPALFTHAVAQHLTWDLNAATEGYRQVLELDPKHIQALMNVITIGLQEKNYDLVQTTAERLIGIDESNELGIEGLALAAFSRADYRTAAHHYRRLTELSGNQAEHWLNLGISLQKQDLLSDAVHVFSLARQVRPDSIHAHTHLGDALWQSGDLGSARACYENALHKWPEREDLTLALSHVLEALDLPEAAEQVCREYCDRQADKEQVWFRLGFVQWQRGGVEPSIDSFSKALELRPVWPEAEVNLALACLTAGNVDRADTILAGLLEREPNHMEALKGMAAIALARKDDPRALQLHLKLIELGERTAEVYFNCGVLAQNLQQLQDAIGYYREAVSLRRDFSEALLNLGHVLHEIGQDDEAKSCWIPALELNPEFSLNYFRRG